MVINRENKTASTDVLQTIQDHFPLIIYTHESLTSHKHKVAASMYSVPMNSGSTISTITARKETQFKMTQWEVYFDLRPINHG